MAGIQEEYIVDVSVEEIGLDADILYKALLGEQCFCITDICPPPIDFSEEDWNVPIDEAMHEGTKRLEVEQLTNEDKTGVFDKVAQSIKDLLSNEHEKGRITSGDYSRTFTALMDSALANSTQFLLQKDLAFWQARKGLYDAWNTKAQVELTKHQISLTQMQQLNQQIAFANGKMQMMVLKENYNTATAQREVVIPKQAEVQDSQIALYSQQIESYQKDAEVKAARIFTDAWITLKTIDEGITPPNGFTNERIDDVLTTIRDSNGFDITP